MNLEGESVDGGIKVYEEALSFGYVIKAINGKENGICGRINSGPS